MKIEVTKKVLFNVLKQALNENRTHENISGIYTNPYFYKDENLNPFLDHDDEDMPIAPSNHMASYRQLSVSEVPVDDPDFVPASIEELKNALVVIAKEVPLDQIDYFYRSSHKILDNALDRSHYDMDDEEPSEDESTLSESINISKKTTIRDYNLISESIDDDNQDLSAFENRPPEFGELAYVHEDNSTSIISFDGMDLEEAIRTYNQVKKIEYEKTQMSYAESAEAFLDNEDLIKKGYQAGKEELVDIEQIWNANEVSNSIGKIFKQHARMKKELRKYKDSAPFKVGYRLSVINELDTIETSKTMSDDELDSQLSDVVDSEYLTLTPKELELVKKSDLKNSKFLEKEAEKDADLSYQEMEGKFPESLVKARQIVETTFVRIMTLLGKEDNSYYMTMVAGGGDAEKYKDQFPVHKFYGIELFKKILTTYDKQRFIYSVRDKPQEAIEKFEEFINNILNVHFFKLNKDQEKLNKLSKYAEDLKGIKVSEEDPDSPVLVSNLIKEIVRDMARNMYEVTSAANMRNPETGELNSDIFLKSYVRQVFSSSRNVKDNVEAYNDYFTKKGLLKRPLKVYREVSLLNFVQPEDEDFLSDVIFDRIIKLSKDDPQDAEKIIITYKRTTMDPARPNYTDELSVDMHTLSSVINDFIEGFIAAAKDYQDAKLSRIETRRDQEKLRKTLSPSEIAAKKEREIQNKKGTLGGIASYMEQNSVSGARQEFVRYPGTKYIYTQSDAGYVADTASFLMVDFIDSVYELVTTRLVHKLDKFIEKAKTQNGSKEVRKKIGFIKKPDGITLYNMLIIAKHDLEKINKIIVDSGFAAVDHNNDLYNLMYTTGGYILRNLANNIIDATLKSFHENLKSSIASNLKVYLPKIKGINVNYVKSLSHEALEGLAEYFMGLKNRPLRTDFQSNKRNTRIWKDMGIDAPEFESLYIHIFEEEVRSELIGFYHKVIPIFDDNSDFVNYDFDPDDVADQYAQEARDIIGDIETKDSYYEKALKQAVADHLNYEETRKSIGDPELMPAYDENR